MRYDGEMAVGRDAIIAKLQAVAQMHAGFRVVHEVVDVQCQPLGFVSGVLGMPAEIGPWGARAEVAALKRVYLCPARVEYTWHTVGTKLFAMLPYGTPKLHPAISYGCSAADGGRPIHVCYQDGSALVNVTGQLVSPAASNKPQPFMEVFVLSQIQVQCNAVAE